MPYDRPVDLKKDLALFPVNLSGWTGQKMHDGSGSLPVGTDEYLYREYTNGKGVPLYLYIGYWGRFRYDSNVFSGRHLSPGYRWSSVSDKMNNITFEGRSFPVKQVVYARGNKRLLLTYFYCDGRGVITNRFSGRLRNGINAMLNQKTNVALLKIFSRPYNSEDSDNVLSAQMEFAVKVLPLLDEYFPSKQQQFK